MTLLDIFPFLLLVGIIWYVNQHDGQPSKRQQRRSEILKNRYGNVK